MTRRTFDGASEEDAVRLACEVFDVPRSRVEYELHRDPFLQEEGIARITAWVKAESEEVVRSSGNERTREKGRDKRTRGRRYPRGGDQRGERRRKTAPRERSKPSAEEVSRKSRWASAVLQDILDRMGLEAQVEAREANDSVVLDINGGETGLIIGRRGETLGALQLLVNKIVNRLPENRCPVTVDAEGYKERRKDALLNLARDLGVKAQETGKTFTVFPMNAHDRRLVHLAISKLKGVVTSSEGEGVFRKLHIMSNIEFQKFCC